MSGARNRDTIVNAKAELLAIGFEPTSVLRAIRSKCLDCSGGMPSEVRDCLVRDCALYPFRMGKNPWRAPMAGDRAKHLNAVKNRPSNGEIGATDEAPE